MFIVFEGIDGVGKSSHIRGVANFLLERGIQHICTSEFGNLPLGKSVRNLMMNYDMTGEEEILLINLIRSYHIRNVLIPSIQANHWILMDRFIESTWAYQHGGKQVPYNIVKKLTDSIKIPKPDLTILLDGDNHRSVAKDKFDKESKDFFNRVKAVYKDRFDQENWITYNTNIGYKAVQSMIREYLAENILCC
ncbi:dTMP kinase [Candidatus Cytomitobacter primus]|uniref:Thymidylate kinase n=1 Tax=Candidatus Cytomitobacter primus TaxID=2066024 RepID=A0A5C0UF27_9PROT|nr:dTMP kinase [Candidatus Cytomitobacter primus]QEK38379.1 dTMP kinase [Candidatus Cytomitobacter primus]